MTLYIDIENKFLVQSLTSDRTVATPIFMQGDNETLILHLLEKGNNTLHKENPLVVGTDFLRVAIAKFYSYLKSLTYASGFTLNSDVVAEVILPLNITEI